MLSARRPMVVFVDAAPGSTLGVAVRAALVQRGWRVAAAPFAPGVPSAVVVVLEDDTGGVRPITPPPGRIDRVIAIGTLRSARALVAHAARGAAILDQDLPLLTLLERIEAELRADRPAAASRDARVRTAEHVRSRAAEARALSGLTHREREVLGGLVLGHAASRIAEEGSRSLPTIRTQIQTVLGRLGVNSQLGAVAIAHRSGRHAGLGECLDSLHDLSSHATE